MKIPFNDFKRDSDELFESELSAVNDVLRSGWWILGNHVKAPALANALGELRDDDLVRVEIVTTTGRPAVFSQ